jgi:hypothetical protein
MKPDPRLVTFVVITITVAWLVALCVGLIRGDYQPLIISTPLEGAIVGYATGMKIWRNGQGS